MERDERETRRDSFLGDSADYFAARPGYPSALLSEAIALGGVAAGARLLEVGCGTGEATVWFVEQGFRVVATDRSHEMLRLAANRLDRFANVDLLASDFERDPPDGRFDALVAATSYHWLAPETRAERCADALRPGGAIVLLWHTHPHPFTGYFARSQSIYECLVPHWTLPSTPGMTEEGIVGIIDELRSNGRFVSIERRSHDWSRVYDRPLYLRLLNTYSDHRLLPDQTRRALYDALAGLIDDEFEGVVERPYRSELIVGRLDGNAG